MAKLSRDPYLKRINANPKAYVDLFVDEFLGLSQGPAHMQLHVWYTLFHALDKFFRPLDAEDSSNRRLVLSLEKLDSGGYTWYT